MRVLVSYPRPRATSNPYIVQLDRALEAEPGVEIIHFSWDAALRRSYDVFHVHWPDALLAGRSPLRRARKRILATALLARLRMRGTPVVRTRHNAVPHESPTVGSFEAGLDRLTRLSIHLNPVTAQADDIVIPHGHYRDWYRRSPNWAPREGAIAFVGHIRPYKGVEHLIAAFRQLTRDGTKSTLTIAGMPRTEKLRQEIVEAARDVDGLTLALEYVDDDDFARTVCESRLIALPYLTIGNSGAALAALSLDRPVLAPRSPTTEELQREVGEEWLVLFEGPLDAVALRTGLELTSSTGGSAPLSAEREWDLVGSRHVNAYRRAIERNSSTSVRLTPPSRPPRETDHLRIQIAIPTFHRPAALRAALDEVLSQAASLPGTLAEAHVLVIDNDAEGSARATVGDGDVSYVVEPRPGIAAVRNRALAESTSFDALIFIDDDEVPADGWLAALVQRFVESGADAVAGRVITLIPDTAPEWIKVSGAFDRPIRSDGTEIDEAATNNLMLDLHAVRSSGITFDERFGLTGGSDSLFSKEFSLWGARIVWAEDAVVVETEDPSRLTRSWILKRVFRFGNTGVRVRLALAPSPAARVAIRLRATVGGVTRIVGGALRVLIGTASRSLALRGRGERTMARGRGMIAGAFGHAHNEYGLRRAAMAAERASS